MLEFPFERAGAVRRFTSRQGQRSFSGLWYFASTGDHAGYESWLERDRLIGSSTRWRGWLGVSGDNVSVTAWAGLTVASASGMEPA